MAYRYTDVNTRLVYSPQQGVTGQAGKIAKFWLDEAGTDPVDVGLWSSGTPDTPGLSAGSNELDVQADGMWPAMWDRAGTQDYVWIQVGTAEDSGDLYRIFCDADQRVDLLAQRVDEIEADGTGSFFLNVADYGIVGDDSTDNYTALQALINTAKTASAGARIYFPPLHNGSRARYRFSSTLDIRACANVRLLSTGTHNYLGGPELIYTGGGSAPGINFGSARGFGIDCLAVTYSNPAYTGTLLNGRIYNGSDTAYCAFNRCWFGPSPIYTEGGTATLMCIDGSHEMTFNECTWFGGDTQLIGKLSEGITSTGGFAIGVTMTGCTFAGAPTTAAILNPDQAWDINAIIEPLAGGVAGFITHSAGLRGRGVTIRGIWSGDVHTAGGAWITWSGDGLTIIGGDWGGSSTIVRVDEDNSHGISLLGVSYPGVGAQPIVSYDSGTSGHTGLCILATDLSQIPPGTSVVDNPPTGSIIQDKSGQTTITGLVSVGGSAVFGGAVTTPGVTVVGSSAAANLLTAAQASYETAGGWQGNVKVTIAQNSTQALVGTKSMEATVTDTSAANTNGSPSVIQTSAGMVQGIVAGQQYTAVASGKGLNTAQSYRLAVAFYDASSVAVGSTTFGPITAGSTSTWTQFTWTGVAPSGATQARMVVYIWTAGGSVGDKHVFDAIQFASGTSTTYVDPGGAPAPLKLENATPATPPINNGVALYVESGQLKAMKANGTVVTLV